MCWQISFSACCCYIVSSCICLRISFFFFANKLTCFPQMVRPSVRILVFPPSQELSLLFVLFAERLPLYHFRPKIKKKVHTKKCFLKMFDVILVVGIYRTIKKYSNIYFYSWDFRNFQKYNCNKKKN